MLKLSVVIPCYNHGKYLLDAINSLPSSDELSFELIIVDDGSNDEITIHEINRLKFHGYTVISHANQGPAYSRNAGIEQAKGEYILPLDADNKIIAPMLLEAINILDEGEYDIIYGKPLFFGENISSRKFVPKSFEGDELYFTNYIDTCAIFKKSVWITNGGYDSGLPYYGNEDWEFWLNAHINRAKFYFLDKECYEYRIIAGSTLGVLIDNEKRDSNLQYIINKHYKHFVEAFARHYSYSNMYRNDLKHPLRSALKHTYHLFNK